MGTILTTVFSFFSGSIFRMILSGIAVIATGLLTWAITAHFAEYKRLQTSETVLRQSIREEVSRMNRNQEVYENDRKRLDRALKITAHQLVDEKSRGRKAYEQIAKLRSVPKSDTMCKLSAVLLNPPWLYVSPGITDRAGSR